MKNTIRFTVVKLFAITLSVSFVFSLSLNTVVYADNNTITKYQSLNNPVFKTDVPEETAKKVYDLILNAISQRNKYVELEAYNLSRINAKKIFDAVINDYKLFDITGSLYTFEDNEEYTGYITDVFFDYLPEADRNEMEGYIKKVTAGITDDMTDLEKVLIVHDYICDNYYYKENEEDDRLSIRTALKFFRAGYGVCGGYADAFKYCMKYLGIPCQFATTKTHQWDIVAIDGEWYHIDPTWDSTNSVHSWFLKSDDNFRGGHGNEWECDYAIADSTKYENAFWRNSRGMFLPINGEFYYTYQNDIYAANLKTMDAHLVYENSHAIECICYDGNNIYALSYDNGYFVIYKFVFEQNMFTAKLDTDVPYKSICKLTFDEGKLCLETDYTLSSKAEYTYDLNSFVALPISVTIEPPSKTDYYQLEEFDPDGMTFTEHYEDGSTVTLNAEDIEYDIKGFDSKNIGKKTVTVTYKGFTSSFDVEILEPYIDYITVVEKPFKTQYYVGDEFDPAGMTFSEHYNNGTSEYVVSPDENDYTIDGFDSNTAGTKTITVTYKGHTDSFTIEVLEPYVTSIHIPLGTIKNHYIIGESFDDTGMMIEVSYNTGTTTTLAASDIEYTIDGFDSNTAGTKKVTLTYQGASYTFTIIVSNAEVTSITVTPPQKIIYYRYYEDFDPTGMKIIEHYNDGTEVIVNAEDVEYDYHFDNAWDLGMHTVNIWYGHFEAFFEIEMRERYTIGIKIEQLPKKTTYYIGDKFYSSGLLVYEEYNVGIPSLILPAEYTLDGFSSDTAGTKKITVTYKNFTAQFDVEVLEPQITGIKVTAPSKTKYYIGEALNLAGMIITETYNSGKTVKVNAADVEADITTTFSSEAAGKQAVTLTYKNLTAEFEIEILEPYITKVKVKSPNKTEYFVGDALNTVGMVITEVYNTGAEKEIPAEDAEFTTDFDSSLAGYYTVTVTYKNFTDTFKVKIMSNPIPSTKPTPSDDPTPTPSDEPTPPTPSDDVIKMYYDRDENKLVIKSDGVQKEAVLIKAIYQYNLLTETEITSILFTDGGTIELAAEPGAQYMLWSDMLSMRPLCEIVNVK